MSGIYIHIPFCKQACHYCDFHFSTQLGKKDSMVAAIQKEMELRHQELDKEEVETIYFGGGTPSVLETEEIEKLIDTVRHYYKVTAHPEITLEANPDDLSEEQTLRLANSPVNRLSIGIQSFYNEDLKMMNRAHNAREAETCIALAKNFFENISIDLIYGIPGMDHERWRSNIEKTLSYDLPHISSYALTVEPKTALKSFIAKGIIKDVDDEQAQEQFDILCETLETHGYTNYEISNFGKLGFYSKNNTSYWQGKTYLGFGPSAHSFNGKDRSWNIRNNIKYIKAIQEGLLPNEIETLTTTDRYNEYVMTGLRTIWGVDEDEVRSRFGPMYKDYLVEQAQKYLDSGLLFWDHGKLLATKKGKFLVDGIASNLFMVNLKA